MLLHPWQDVTKNTTFTPAYICVIFNPDCIRTHTDTHSSVSCVYVQLNTDTRLVSIELIILLKEPVTVRLLLPTVGNARTTITLANTHSVTVHTLTTQSSKQTQHSLHLSPSVIWTPTLPIFCLGLPVDRLWRVTSIAYSRARFKFPCTHLECHKQYLLSQDLRIDAGRYMNMQHHTHVKTHIQRGLAVLSRGYKSYCTNAG